MSLGNYKFKLFQIFESSLDSNKKILIQKLSLFHRLFDNWLNNQDRPQNGSLVKLETNNGETKAVVV